MLVYLANGGSCKGLVIEFSHFGAPVGSQLSCQGFVQLLARHHIRSSPHPLKSCCQLWHTTGQRWYR